MAKQRRYAGSQMSCRVTVPLSIYMQMFKAEHRRNFPPYNQSALRASRGKMKTETRPAIFLALAVAIAAAYKIGFLKYLDYRYTQNVAKLDLAHGNKLEIQGRHLRNL
jgi:hypothetical protein